MIEKFPSRFRRRRFPRSRKKTAAALLTVFAAGVVFSYCEYPEEDTADASDRDYAAAVEALEQYVRQQGVPPWAR